MYDLMWLQILMRVNEQKVSRERMKEFERELINRIGFGGLKPIIRSFLPW